MINPNDSVWVVTFNDTDGRGGTYRCCVGVFSSEELAEANVSTRQWPASWYDIDEFKVDND